MKAIDVLGRSNAVGHRRFVDMSRQGKLHQDAVDVRVFVQVIDQVQQFFLAGRFIQVEITRDDSRTLAIPALGVDVDR